MICLLRPVFFEKKPHFCDARFLHDTRRWWRRRNESENENEKRRRRIPARWKASLGRHHLVHYTVCPQVARLPFCFKDSFIRSVESLRDDRSSEFVIFPDTLFDFAFRLHRPALETSLCALDRSSRVPSFIFKSALRRGRSQRRPFEGGTTMKRLFSMTHSHMFFFTFFGTFSCGAYLFICSGREKNLEIER